ncbi:GyrI-like domain-containing protein [Paenibacillus tarimensis]
MDWLERMSKAVDYMENNLNIAIRIEQIAKEAYSSPFHFQRMFQMLTGMTVADYMRKRIVTLAAQELAVSASKVIDVSAKYGYETPESFAKAFKKIQGIAPSEVRQSVTRLKAFPRLSTQMALKGEKALEYRIESQGAFPVVGKLERMTCNDQQQVRQVPAFWEYCQRDGTLSRLASANSRGHVMGITMDMQPEDEEFTYMIATKGEDSLRLEGEYWIERTIPASTWAIFASDGPIPEEIQRVTQRIYQEWFPSTDYEHAGTPEMEVYPPGDPTKETYRCEIWIPIMNRRQSRE